MEGGGPGPHAPAALLSLTSSLLGCENCWRLASLKPLPPSMSLTLSISTGFSNLNCMAMPPAKSVPRLALPIGMAKTATMPIRMSIAEITKVIFRFPRKSIRVSPRMSKSKPPYGAGNKAGPAGLNAQRLYPEPLTLDVESHLGADKRGEQVYKYAEAERYRKALYGAAAELEEHGGGDKRRYMGVNDGPPRVTVPGVYRRARGPPALQFLFYPLEYKDIGVNAHADRKDDACDARQGERGAGPRQGPEQHDDVQQYREVRYRPGEPVVEYHEQEHEGRAEYAGPDAGPYRGGAARGG